MTPEDYSNELRHELAKVHPANTARVERLASEVLLYDAVRELTETAGPITIDWVAGFIKQAIIQVKD